MTSITVNLIEQIRSPFVVGEFVKVKYTKDLWLMVTKTATTESGWTVSLIKPNFYKRKSGYAVERMRKIYKHKPKSKYYA